MREVIRWPIRVWLLFIFLDIAILLSIGVVLTDFTLIVFALALLTLTILFSFKSRLQLRVTKDSLTAGPATLESKNIKEIIVLDEAAMRFERGSGIDPRAFLALRFWVKGGVKVILDDPRDPTPYWLISTRKPEELKAQLQK